METIEICKSKNLAHFLKILEKNFPKLIIPQGIPQDDLAIYEKIEIIEKIPKAMITSKNEKIGEINSYRLTPYGFKFLNEFTLKKINQRIFWLTVTLVIIGIIQIIILL